MVDGDFSTLTEIFMEKTLLGIKNQFNIKTPNNEKVASLQMLSAMHSWEGFSILDNQNNIIVKVEGQELTQSKEAIARILDSNNETLATIITKNASGNLIYGTTNAIVSNNFGQLLFEITADYTASRGGKPPYNIKFLNNGREIAQIKLKFGLQEKYDIKLIENVDMRIIAASFWQFFNDAQRVSPGVYLG